MIATGDAGHQNWLALRQEWKKRPVDWAPKRRLTLDPQTVRSEIQTVTPRLLDSDEHHAEKELLIMFFCLKICDRITTSGVVRSQDENK